MTDDVTVPCRACRESVSIDASKCPHCGTWQYRSRAGIAGLLVGGLVLTGATAWMAPTLWSFGVPDGLVAPIVVGLLWALVLVGPVMLLLALAGFQQRREALG